MKVAIVASALLLLASWWFTTLLVLCGWTAFFAIKLLKAGAEGGFFDK